MPILTRLIGRVKRKEQKGLQFALNECVQFALNECVQFAGRHARRAEELGERELGHQARGARTLELGDRCELIVSEATVKSHVASILRKLVPSSENRSHGATLGDRLERFCNGTRFR